MKTLALRLLPGAVLVTATIALLVVPDLAGLAHALVPAYPLAAFAAALLLAGRFGRHRTLAMVLMVALAERVLAVVLAGETPVRIVPIIVGAVGVALPVNITVLGWLPERGRFHVVLGWTAGLLTVEVLLTALLVQAEVAPLAATLTGPLGTGWRHVPAAAAGAFAVALVMAAVRVVAQPQPIECGTLWALVASLLAFGAGTPGRASIALAGAGVVMLVAAMEASYDIAYGDELTGLPGRRALTDALGRLQGAYTIAMVDVDHFKKFNDSYGHDAGDQLLRMIGARLGSVGGGGRAYRYGGEEFAVIFPGARVDDTLGHLDALRRSIEQSGFALRAKDRPRRKEDARPAAQPVRRVSVSVSIGVAEADRRRRPQDVLEAADAALYRAKRAGRNRIAT